MKQFIRNLRLLFTTDLAARLEEQATLIESFNALVEMTVTLDKKLDGYNAGVYNRRRLPTSERPRISTLALKEAARIERLMFKKPRSVKIRSANE
jgi:hypothetical protein